MTTTSTPAQTLDVARWEDEYGNTYEWPQGLADNRRSRVLARIARRSMACDPRTLTITREARVACTDPACPLAGHFAHDHAADNDDEAHFLYAAKEA